MEGELLREIEKVSLTETLGVKVEEMEGSTVTVVPFLKLGEALRVEDTVEDHVLLRVPLGVWETLGVGEKDPLLGVGPEVRVKAGELVELGLLDKEREADTVPVVRAEEEELGEEAGEPEREGDCDTEVV